MNLQIENQLDEKTKKLIDAMEKVIEVKDAELEAKDVELEAKITEINKLKNELDFLKNQLLNKNRKIFGSSTEQVSSDQISFFNEAEKNSDSKLVEPQIEEITYKRKKNSVSGKKDNLAILERVIIEHKLSEEEMNCNDCGTTLVTIGTKSKEILKYVPAKLFVEEHITYSYACKKCEETNDIANITAIAAPKSIIPKSMASNELLAHVVLMKYLYALPLYRQESYFKMLGANLSRQTLSNWAIGVSNAFTPMYEYMKKQLLACNYIQADETTLKIVNDKGEDARAKSYMWLYMSNNFGNPIILYDFQKTRSSACPKKYLGEFNGYLQTDGYAGYNSVTNAKRLYCLAHIRRKYHEIIISLNDEALKKSRAIIGFNLCADLYKIEKDLLKSRDNFETLESFYEERRKVRNEKSSLILDKFEEYVKDELVNALPSSPLGKALDYSQKLLPKMRLILEDGSLEIDNNAAERSIKPFVIGRKNWLFSNTPKGANASAILYSIIETAKANNLIIEKYLVYVMNKLSAVDIITDKLLTEVMPWYEKLPVELKIIAPRKLD